MYLAQIKPPGVVERTHIQQLGVATTTLVPTPGSAPVNFMIARTFKFEKNLSRSVTGILEAPRAKEFHA